MLRKFLADKRGNYAMITGLLMAPLFGAVALAVDYSEMSRQRLDTRNALDAANIATARELQAGATDSKAIAYANDFYFANLRHVKPAKTSLDVTLPNNSVGGGSMKMCASLNYSPYFFPAAAMLMGQQSRDFDFITCSEVRLKNTLEVSLVLDNSGSMTNKGSGTGQQRLALLKTAAKQLVDTMALEANQMKQVDRPIQFSLVPFAASVNVGPQYDTASWMDTMGISPIHHENFDWSTMTKDNSPFPDKYVEKVGDVWYKRGKNWGESEDHPMTRFSLYNDILYESTRTRNAAGQYVYSTSQYASWNGCVEARPFPFNANDATPSTGNPASMFVPMFAPDEPGTVWLDFDRDGKVDKDPTTKNKDFKPVSQGYQNNWWMDWQEYARRFNLSPKDQSSSERQRDMRKYFVAKPYGATGSGNANYSCTTSPITPLQDISDEKGKDIIKTAIDDMAASGNTNVPEGLAWGWRTLSSGEPFTEGRPEIERGNDKVLIVLTDGANTYSSMSDASYAGNRSTYAAYGYTGVNYDNKGMTRLFLNTSNKIGKTTHTSTNFTAALDEQLQTLCSNAKEANIIIMTVSLDLSMSKSAEKKAIEAMKECASESRYRMDANDPSKPAKLYWNATGASLSDDFKEIADELSNLRITS
ncbi:pilus assembly protein TadG-related protein [Aquamicrobium terrae]